MEGAMARPLTVIALVLAILAVVFHFANIAGAFLIVLVLAALILLAIGVLTGR